MRYRKRRNVQRRGNWTPDPLRNQGAAFVGTLGDNAWTVLNTLIRVRQVYAVPGTWHHIMEEHGQQFDLARGQELLPVVLNAPEGVYLTSKKGSYALMGEYDTKYALIVVSKALDDELWLETIYIVRKERLDGERWKSKRLYRRQ